jgi:hypothetical protein
VRQSSFTQVQVTCHQHNSLEPLQMAMHANISYSSTHSPTFPRAFSAFVDLIHPETAFTPLATNPVCKEDGPVFRHPELQDLQPAVPIQDTRYKIQDIHPDSHGRSNVCLKRARSTHINNQYHQK